MTGRNAFAHHLVGVRKHFLHDGDTLGNRLAGTAGILDAVSAQQRSLFEMLGTQQRVDLVRLASQPNDQHAGKVGVARITAQRAAQNLHAFALDVHAAAAAVRQRNHTINVGKIGERAAFECVGNAVGNGGGTIHRRQNAEIVARRHAPVGANDAHEGCRRVDELCRLGVFRHTERIVAM